MVIAPSIAGSLFKLLIPQGSEERKNSGDSDEFAPSKNICGQTLIRAGSLTPNSLRSKEVSGLYNAPLRRSGGSTKGRISRRLVTLWSRQLGLKTTQMNVFNTVLLGFYSGCIARTHPVQK